ncbi:Ras of Complex, Roc, domain of DAPkinase [Candidatus Electrothrix aarhusensis]|uniref:non-specific serine/threonine protein kinase n=1 Tax=Candidatus Electrothrix aarhusensis TaxID=1859131 RepID=A0A3S3QGP8_9BACT|nr:Ras of Complex, Roc, domain of DAPkinase [Candidatus Electrothrix aarhusensis]
MDKEELKKELEPLPKEWQTAFIARVAAQFSPTFEQIKAQKDLFDILRIDINLESISTIISDKNYAKYTFSEEGILIHGCHEAFEKPVVNLFSISLSSCSANEINFLKKYIDLGEPSAEYFYKPLYTSQSQEWLQKGQKFVQFLRDYGHGFDIWADWFQGRTDGVPTDKQFLEAVVNLPKEILAQEPKYINAYLKSLGNAAGALNRARVIFLGAGYAGKTSLVRALNDQEVIAGMEQETPGIDISTWQVPGTEITANFWDFGGQVMAHATHQFFFRSRCLYVLVLEGRSETNANEQAEYWLYHVKVYGGNAPVILVGNKDEDCPVNLDMARLKEKHDNVLGFYPLSCIQYQDEYADKFRSFKNDLIKEIEKLGVHQIRFSKAHLAVLDELTSLSGTESFLPKNDWLNLCADKGLAEHGDLNQAWLLDLFDKLGVIVHFPKLAALDSYILNPRWLTYGVYTLLYSKEAKEKKGRLQESEIIRILSEAEVRDHLGNILSYPQEKAWIVLKAMEEFDLSFPCRHEPDSIVIPALLDSDQPEHGFAKHDSLAFEFDFTGFLPRHIMPNFIVGRHDEIKGELVWQNGVVLQRKDESAEALVQVDYHDRKLALWLRGPKANDYFKILYDDFGRILERMPELRFKEFVIVPETSRIGKPPLNFHRSDQPIQANFRQLLAMEEKGRAEYDHEDGGTFDLTKILQIMPKKEDRQQLTVNGDQITVYGDNFMTTGGSSTVAKDHATIKQNAAPEKLDPVVSPEKPKWYQQWWFISCVIGLLAGLVAAWQLHSFDLALACCALGFGVALLFNPLRRFFRTALSVLGFVTGANTLSGLEANIDLSGLMDKPVAFMFKLGVGDKPWLNVALVALAGFLFWLDSKEDK